ncbi:hypothetical protein GCM10009648_18240 [Tsukamurella spumae]
MQLGDLRVTGQRVEEGVFAAAGADDEYSHVDDLTGDRAGHRNRAGPRTDPRGPVGVRGQRWAAPIA